ncbi:hypothetical protein B0A48_09312 [Cryoendolithus antarcticus]|uniref:DhaL domain-containing protein n=1 Tax=Cryoendolithus antarcticus TaxID=1507870 RepID=A0A1V8T304_9PEZI|nr:hypothetical protein B0A48_09312 [Cryoendolithus antarcticus]
MAVVVEQTIPFDASALDLKNPTRWSTILPLMRPNVRATKTPKNQTILIDEAQADSKSVGIAAIGNLGNFSSKLLDDKQITAIVTDQRGSGVLTAQDVDYAIKKAGVKLAHGLVVVRSGKEMHVEVHESDLVEIEVKSEVEMDHVIHLINNATDSCRASIHRTTELLKIFAKQSSTAYSRFHVEKADGNPAIVHGGGQTLGFEKAKHAIERDLKHVLKFREPQTVPVTVSVHYSDVNGLSRLENYILAKEIAEYLEAKLIPYRLSHSTILDHKELARGFAVSICPLPVELLSAQPKPKAHQAAATSDTSERSAAAVTSKSKMIFDDAQVRIRIQAGCKAVIDDEPRITEYDTIVGDGDCGYTLRDGAKQVLAFIEGKDLSLLPQVVGDLVLDLEVNMGGTSGALYCIFLTALAASLAAEESVPKALQSALDQLMKYTRARLADRTMMDALIPFVDTLNKTGDAQAAVVEAEKGVEGTKKMEAQLGRSAYLDESTTQGVPDPGAYGLLILLKAMSSAA